MTVVSFIIPFILTLGLMPLVIKFSYKRHFLCYPGENSIHTKPIPVTGGLLIFFVFFVTSLIFKKQNGLMPFFLGASIMLISGLYDDVKGSNAIWKLAIQLITALIVASCGIFIVQINLPFVSHIKLGMFSIPVTILWFIAIMNLINVIDGLDGLAAGLCAITLFVIFLFVQSSSFNIQLFTLIGTLLAFLIFNFHPAKIFLGNSGSSFLGFSIAYFSIITSQKSTITPLLLVPCGILLLHIFDLVYAVIRRSKNGTSIFKGDKKHIHHLAFNVIKDHRLTVLLFYLMALILAFITIEIMKI